MSDTVEIKPEPESKPDPKIEKTLDGILGWVQKKKAQAEDPKVKKVTKSSPWGWVVGLVAAVLIFFALAFLAWRAWSKGREIAKLKHELDVKKEEERRARVDAALGKNAKERKELEAKATEAALVAGRIKKEIAEIEFERKLEHEAIDRVTSWEDVDKLMEDGK